MEELENNVEKGNLISQILTLTEFKITIDGIIT